MSLMPQEQDGIPDILGYLVGYSMGPTGFVSQPLDPKTEITVIPRVKDAPRDAKIPARRGYLFGDVLIVLDPAEPKLGSGIQIVSCLHKYIIPKV
jgi:hypothetical protein